MSGTSLKLRGLSFFTIPNARRDSAAATPHWGQLWGATDGPSEVTAPNSPPPMPKSGAASPRIRRRLYDKAGLYLEVALNGQMVITPITIPTDSGLSCY